MKKRYYANVKIVDIRQVEFEAEDGLTNDELEDLALDVVQREWGSFDEAEVVELDYALQGRLACNHPSADGDEHGNLVCNVCGEIIDLIAP